MKTSRNAISNRIIVVVLIVVIVAAAAAYYLLSAPPSSGTTTPTSTLSTTITPTTATQTSATQSTPITTPTSTVTSSSTTSLSSSTPTSTFTTTTTSTSSTSSVAATETLACIATNSTTEDVQLVIDFLNAYSSMAINIQGTRNGSAVNTTMSFSTVYASSTTFKVNTDFTNATGNYQATIWVQKSGIVTALYYNGRNYTNSARVTEFLVNLLSPLATYHDFGTQLTNSPSFFRETGTSSMTIGTNTFQVTNYVTASPNVVIPTCNDVSYALTTYDLSVGTPTGTTYEIVPHMDIAGSDVITTLTGTRTATFDYVIQITAFTIA